MGDEQFSQQELLAERNVFERVAVRADKADIRTPLGMFMYGLSEAYDHLHTRLVLAGSDKYSIMSLATSVPDPGHKSPYAFVYGYKIVSASGEISRQMLDFVATRLDFNVALPDVLRYARLILSLKK